MKHLLQLLTRNPYVIVPFSLVAIAVSVWLVAGSLFSEGETGELRSMVYFYDLNTKELFTVPAGTMPPIATDSGDHQGRPAGVRAHLFSCGNESDWFIGYLETTAESLPPEQRPASGRLVMRLVDDSTWYDPMSKAGQQVLTSIGNRCRQQGVAVKVVQPVPRRG